MSLTAVRQAWRPRGFGKVCRVCVAGHVLCDSALVGATGLPLRRDIRQLQARAYLATRGAGHASPSPIPRRGVGVGLHCARS